MSFKLKSCPLNNDFKALDKAFKIKSWEASLLPIKSNFIECLLIKNAPQSFRTSCSTF